MVFKILSLLITFTRYLKQGGNTSFQLQIIRFKLLDILYKESDGLAVRVLDTITTTDTEWTGDIDIYGI